MMLLSYNCIGFNSEEIRIGTKVAIDDTQQLVSLMHFFAKEMFERVANKKGTDLKNDNIDEMISVQENIKMKKDVTVNIADISQFIDFVGSNDNGRNDLIYYRFIAYCEDSLKSLEKNSCEENRCEKNSLKVK